MILAVILSVGLLAGGAAFGQTPGGSASKMLYLGNAHGYAFCEIHLMQGKPPEPKARAYNTSGASDCPPEKFDALDPQALAKAFHVDAVFLNPRRLWMMDRLWSYDAGETYDFDGVKATWMGKLELKNVNLGEHDRPFPIYKESEITRRQWTNLKPDTER